MLDLLPPTPQEQPRKKVFEDVRRSGTALNGTRQHQVTRIYSGIGRNRKVSRNGQTQMSVFDRRQQARSESKSRMKLIQSQQLDLALNQPNSLL